MVYIYKKKAMRNSFKNQFYYLTCMILSCLVIVSCGDGEDPVDECVTTDITYTSYAKSLLDSTCASSSCHSEGNKDVIGSLANIDDVKEFVAGGFNIIGAINHEEGVSNMPKNGSKMDQCDIDKITAWVNAGTPE